MDKRKKYFCVVAMVLILLSGYGKSQTVHSDAGDQNDRR